MELHLMSAELLAGPAFHASTHMKIFFALAGVCLLITVLSSLVLKSTQAQRRGFWVGTVGAALFSFVGALPDWLGGLAFAAGCVFVMAMSAYFTSSYIKIGGKVYAFHTRDDQPDGPPGTPREPVVYDPAEEHYGTDVTAKKLWWLAIPAMGLCAASVAINVGTNGRLSVVLTAAVCVVVIAVGLGYASDASWGYRIARGQYVQFVLVGIITAGVFTVLYLLAYIVGRRWPYRYNKSLERPAPPRPSRDKSRDKEP
jgi:uncharacterized membrane protein YciS (DUF1049 family)